MLEFVSYDGSWPNLCRGRLVMRLGGEEFEFPDGCLMSGCDAGFDKDWNEEVTSGSWCIVEYPKGFPEGLEEYANYLVNKHVEPGCCGGCL